jgi:prolyl 4-hydroxylase
MAKVEDQSMNGGGVMLKQQVWDAARSTIEQWTGQRLAECSLYGIRIYEEGAILATHVDRLPLVSSAIINVDQDVDEPWPLEVIGHDGKAVNITASTEHLKLVCENWHF